MPREGDRVKVLFEGAWYEGEFIEIRTSDKQWKILCDADRKPGKKNYTYSGKDNVKMISKGVVERGRIMERRRPANAVMRAWLCAIGKRYPATAIAMVPRQYVKEVIRSFCLARAPPSPLAPQHLRPACVCMCVLGT